MREFAHSETAVLLRRLAFQVNRAAKSSEPDCIHDLRVAIRRFSRCVRTFAQFFPGRSWKKVRSRLKKMMRAAGAVRDCDIALELAAGSGVPATAVLMKRIGEARVQAQKELRDEIRRWKARNFSRRWRNQLELE